MLTAYMRRMRVRMGYMCELGSSWVVIFCAQVENINAILSAAGVTGVEPFFPGLFAKLASKMNIMDLITNVGAGAFGGTGR